MSDLPDFFTLAPEVAGELGIRTVMDTSVHPPRVSALHFVLSGWLGDDLLETFPCYLVTDALAQALEHGALTGATLDVADVEVSDQFRELYPTRMPPTLSWLRVEGEARRDDFGVSADHLLVVSKRALDILRRFTLSQCDIDEA